MVSEFLKEHFLIKEDNYEDYRQYQVKEFDGTMKKINEERRKLQIQINHVSSLMENYARNFNRQNTPDELQKKVYHKDIQMYEDQIDYLQKELSKLALTHRSTIMELDLFVR